MACSPSPQFPQLPEVAEYSPRDPLAEKLAGFRRTVSGDEAYQQRLLEIPGDLDNIIPTILAENEGKVVVLDFWATWCSPCLREFKTEYPRLTREFEGQNVAFVFLARQSSEAAWRQKIAGLDFSGQHYLTNAEQTTVTNELFGIGGIPHHTIFDREGRLVEANAPRAGNGLRALIQKTLDR